MATFRNPGLTISVQNTPIAYTSISPRPDPAWTATDSNGHVHQWEPRTFQWVQIEPDWIDADGEEHNGDGYQRCIICGEVVTPGLIGPSPFVEYVPGPTEVTVTFSDGTISHPTMEQVEAVRPLLTEERWEEAERILRLSQS